MIVISSRTVAAPMPGRGPAELAGGTGRRLSWSTRGWRWPAQRPVNQPARFGLLRITFGKLMPPVGLFP